MVAEIFIGDVVFGLAFAFIAGIAEANLGWNILLSFAVALGAGFLFLIAKKRFTLASLLVLLGFVIALVCGAFYLHLYVNWQNAKSTLPVGKSVSFTGIVVDEPRESAKFTLLTVEPIVDSPRHVSSDASEDVFREVTIFITRESGYGYGDELKILGSVEASQPSGEGEAVFPKTIARIALHRGFWLREKMLDIKSAIIARFNELLSPDEAALLGGEVLGGTQGMSSELKSQMAASGTSYVASMYGYKISMLIMLLEEGLKELIARRFRFYIIIGVVVLFLLMIGGNVSAIRGAIMAIMALVARHVGRAYRPRNALILTATIMALFDPTIMAQTSFELSFLSIIGIISLSRPLRRLFFGDDGGSGMLEWRSAVVMVIASLLPILPIIAVNFGNFSLSAFPSNILISFAISPLMVLGLLLAVIAAFSRLFSLLVAKPVSLLLWYQLSVIKLFSVVVVPLPPLFHWVLFTVSYYGVLTLFACWFST